MDVVEAIDKLIDTALERSENAIIHLPADRDTLRRQGKFVQAPVKKSKVLSLHIKSFFSETSSTAVSSTHSRRSKPVVTAKETSRAVSFILFN